MDYSSQHPIHAVLIEDDPHDLRLVRELLSTGDGDPFEIRSARELSEGITLLADGTADIVLLDLRLPDCQGLTALIEVRVQAPTVPVVVLSGLDDEALAAEATREGAKDFLVKGRFNGDLLVRAVHYAIERQRDEERIKHLNAVLRAIRQINQLITQETDRKRLLARACNLLVENGGYRSVWIGLVDDSGRLKPTADANLSGAFDELVKRCAQGTPPACAQRALAQPSVVVKARGSDLCRGCPLREHNSAANELCARIERNGTLYGTLCAAMPPGMRPDDEQQALFADVAADLAYALESMDRALEHRVLEWQLVQAQKLEAIGQLTAGIAHEINTPVQYVGDNMRFLNDAFQDIRKALDVYHRLADAVKTGTVTRELVTQVEAALDEADMDFLREEVPGALHQTLEGIERVAGIVRAMKEFSRPGIVGRVPADINRAIEATVTVARNAWKYVAEMELDLDPDLRDVPCHLGKFNQAILNIILNAARAIGEAIGDTTGGAPRGRITVATRRTGEWAEVRISDTGTGIPEAVRARLFDPFLSTEGAGPARSRGHGLAYCHSVIVGEHGGTIAFETEEGVGTTVIIRLPLEPALVGNEAARRPG